jgi:hypothetical protein
LARQLIAEEQSPTNVAIRAKLGGGSYREIAQHLTTFRIELDEKEKLDIPNLSAIETLIKDAAKDIALLAHRQHQQALKSTQDAAAKKLEKVESAINENVQIIRMLEQEVDDLEARFQEARREQDAAVQAKRRAQAQAEERADSLKKSQSALAASQHENTEQRQLLGKHIEITNTLTHKHAAILVELNGLKAELDAYRKKEGPVHPEDQGGRSSIASHDAA